VWGISGREGDRGRESRLKEGETEHRRRPEMVWVGNDCWGEHLRMFGLTKQSNVNPIGH
jgi:hypothetical protein